MDLFPARLTGLPTQRVIGGLIALFVTSIIFRCLISGDDSRPKPSSRRSNGVTLNPRATAQMQTPGEIAGLVLGIILGVLAVSSIVWLFRAIRRKVTGWRLEKDSPALPEVHNRHYAVEERVRGFQRHWPTSAGEPEKYRRFTLGEVPQHHQTHPRRPAPRSESLAELPSTGRHGETTLSMSGSVGPPFGSALAGSPMLFWKPTEMERNMASRISLDDAPSMISQSL